MAERLLIIGWDGADWEILEDLMARGCLPNVRAMVAGGARAVLRSTIPVHSWAAWPTFLTGRQPGGHGVFDFVERRPDDPRRRIPVTSRSIRATTFLELLSEAGHEVRSANVPVTFPPLRVRGRMIGGVAVPPDAAFVHPPAFAEELARRAPFPTNGMPWMRYRSRPQDLVEEARELVLARTRSFEVMLEGDWTVAVCVFVAPDRLQHPLGRYLIPSHTRHPEVAESPLAEGVRGVFRVLDEAIERLVGAGGSDVTVVLVSDHGFRPLDHAASLDRILTRLGFAGASRTGSTARALHRSGLARAAARTRVGRALKQRVRAPSELDWSRTLAYRSVTGGGISLNVRGREPDGVVAPSDFEGVRSDLVDALLGYRDPRTGERPVTRVLLREDLPPGPALDLAPDLLVWPAPGWAFSNTDLLSGPADWPDATHRIEGILAASGRGIEPGSDLGERDLADVAPTALAFAGVPLPDCDGIPIEPIAGRSPEGVPVGPGAAAAAAAGPARAGTELSEEQNEDMARHLRDLGYIE